MDSDVLGVGLEPFGISPDPRFVYFDPKLRRDHQLLLDGLRNGIGLAIVSGERGVGKTMLLHCLAEELDAADHLVVYLSCLGGPSLDEIMVAFGVQVGFRGQSETNQEAENRISLAGMLRSIGVCGNTAILLLDDADSLTAETLSALLAMLKADTNDDAAVSIVLAGSQDLARRLDRIRDRPGDQHEAHVSLTPLSLRDVESYVLHRLQMAGYGGTQVLMSEAIARVAHYSHGNPQAINRICRAAMVIAAGQSRKAVSAQVIDQVAPSGDEGRPPETMRPEAIKPEAIKIEHERRPPQVNAGLDKVRETVASANSRRHGVSPRFQAARPTFTPTASDEALTRERADRVIAGASIDAPNEKNRTLGSEMPSGRDLTSHVLVDAKDLTRARVRGHGRKRWAALGVLSVVGAVAVYLLADGQTNDKASLSPDVPANSGEDTSRTESLAGPAQSGEVSSPSGVVRSPAPERNETALSEASGSPLEKAVLMGDVKAIAALLDAGADINAPIADGGTLLMVAADKGDEAMVRYLIDRGANPSLGTSNTDSESGFSTAAGTSAPGMPQASGGPAARENAIVAMTHEGSEMEGQIGKSDLGVTPLIAAARAGHADVVYALLTAGAKVNAADARGQTPLMAAVDVGDKESVRLLLMRDADIHAVDDTGRSALDIAREKNRPDLVHLISTRAEPVSPETAATQLSAPPQQAKVDAKSLELEGAAMMQPQPRERSRAEGESAPGAMRAEGESAPGAMRAEGESAPGAIKNRARATQTQKYLRDLGYDPGPVDGVPGSKTQSAVRSFQRDQGIKVDGQITASLLMSLAAEAGTREARQMTAEMPAKTAPAPKTQNFFHAMLSELQKLRGLDFNSTENPAKIYEYCGKNADNWIFDKGIGETVYCKNYLQKKNL